VLCPRVKRYHRLHISAPCVMLLFKQVYTAFRSDLHHAQHIRGCDSGFTRQKGCLHPNRCCPRCPRCFPNPQMASWLAPPCCRNLPATKIKENIQQAEEQVGMEPGAPGEEAHWPNRVGPLQHPP